MNIQLIRGSAGRTMIMAVLLGLMIWAMSAIAYGAESDNTFTFSDSKISVSGDGENYSISGTDLTISGAGTYTVKGSCSDGSITVKKETTGVNIILDGIELSSSDSAVVSCNKSTEVTLTVNGKNTLTDKESIENEADEDFGGAAIKAKSGASLVIEGSGTLNVNGECKNGIKAGAQASVTIDGAAVNITSVNNGLAADGNIEVKSGKLNIVTDGDGIKADPDEDDTESAGTVKISGGTVTINSGEDGIQASGNIDITGGTLNITTAGGYKTNLDEDTSAKGIKSDADITISGGKFTLNCADDAVHCGGDLNIKAGSFEITSGDDAIHADSTLNVGVKNSSSGPEIKIISAYEGLEATVINLYSGDADIRTSDDGINASEKNTELSTVISVYGGTWYVNADGDGVDSNGDISLYGGIVETFGSSSSANAALDYDGKCTNEGGTVLAVGSSGMAQVVSSGNYVSFGASGMFGGGGFNTGDPASKSENGTKPENGSRPSMGDAADFDPSKFENSDGTVQRPSGNERPDQDQTLEDNGISITSGTKIEIRDSKGNAVYSATGVKNANSVVFSSDDIEAGETYYLYLDGEKAAEAEGAEGNGSGGFGGGPENGGQTPGSFTRFTDVSTDSWYSQYVNYVSRQGLMTGTSENEFSPELTTSRGMIVTILYRLEGSPDAGNSTFTDVDSSKYYSKAIAWAAENGIVSGYSKTSFGPDDNITREQLAVILMNYSKYKNYDTSATSDLSGFKDSSKISSYAEKAISWAKAEGLVTGVTETTIEPGSTATRAQVAAILTRFCQKDR